MFSGTWLRLALVRITDVTEKYIAPESSVYVTRATRHYIPENSILHVGLEVFAAVNRKNALFRDVKPNAFCKNRPFGGTSFHPDDWSDTFWPSAPARATMCNIPEDGIPAIPNIIPLCSTEFNKKQGQVQLSAVACNFWTKRVNNDPLNSMAVGVQRIPNVFV
jgi:hypothetical protein